MIGSIKMTNNDRINELLNTIPTLFTELKTLVEPFIKTKVTVFDDLQAALDKGGNIEIDGKFVGSYILRTNGTHLAGVNNSSIASNIKAEAIIIPPGVRDISIDNVELSSSFYSVLRVGENSINQVTTDQCPSNITLRGISIPIHRNRRGFEIHGMNMLIESCILVDIYDPLGSDSQAIYLGNTPGDITIRDCKFSAGSEVFLSGGDSYKIPNVTPTSVLVDNCNFYRPASWRTDGIKRKVKNLFEVKNGENFEIANCQFDGSWQDGQTGECFVLTPAIDGSVSTPPKQSGTVRNIYIRSCVVRNVSTVFSILGRHYTSFTPDALTLDVDGLEFECNKLQNSGRGIFALIGGEPDIISLKNVKGTFDGTSFIYYYGGDVLDPVTKFRRPAGKIDVLDIIGSTIKLPTYGINLMGGELNTNWKNYVETAKIESNTFSGNTAKLKTIFPSNSFI